MVNAVETPPETKRPICTYRAWTRTMGLAKLVAHDQCIDACEYAGPDGERYIIIKGYVRGNDGRPTKPEQDACYHEPLPEDPELRDRVLNYFRDRFELGTEVLIKFGVGTQTPLIVGDKYAKETV